MTEESSAIRLLLVDDEADFRRATRRILERRGFSVEEAASGDEAIASVRRERPDVVVLDLKMPGLSGIETLRRIREIHEALPVIILTGHGSFQDALAGIRMEIVDFLQKPVDIDLLGKRILERLKQRPGEPLKERTVADLMVSPALYPKLYLDDPVEEALETLVAGFFQPRDPGLAQAQGIRSALVYDRNETFVGLVRFSDLLKVVLPPFLGDSPYTTYFTGMFLAQCKVIGKRKLRELMGENVSVDQLAPLMEAVHLMVRHHLINLPVMAEGKLVGVLRERDIILEIAGGLGSLK